MTLRRLLATPGLSTADQRTHVDQSSVRGAVGRLGGRATLGRLRVGGQGLRDEPVGNGLDQRRGETPRGSGNRQLGDPGLGQSGEDAVAAREVLRPVQEVIDGRQIAIDPDAEMKCGKTLGHDRSAADMDAARRAAGAGGIKSA